jgi:rubrerythrin
MDYQKAMVVAMKREEEAWQGYSKMAKMSDNKDLKDLFMLLAQVEAGHLRRIEALYEKEVLEGY